MYEAMKDGTPQVEVAVKGEDELLLAYVRGEWNKEYHVKIGGESDFYMGDGSKKTATLSRRRRGARRDCP